MKHAADQHPNGPRRISRYRLRSSISALLHGSLSSRHSVRSEARADERMEAIRDVMLAATHAAREDYPHVVRRITHATDIQTLWYLRGDAMQALASILGEKAARHRMAEISGMFHGLLPRGLTARKTSLGH